MRLYRVVLLGLALLGVAGCGGEQASQSAARVHEWSMLVGWPEHTPAHDAAHRLASRLRQASGGRLAISVQSAATTGEIFAQVGAGDAQLGHSAPVVSAAHVPAAHLFMSVPFGMDADQFAAWIYNGDGLQLWRELYAPHGVVPYLAGHGGMLMAGWFSQPLSRADGLRGVRIRADGIAAGVLERLGAAAHSVPAQQVSGAISSGQLDAALWNPMLEGDAGTLAKHHYYPGWQGINSTLELLVNREALQALPKDLQEVIRLVTTAEAYRVYLQQLDADMRAAALQPQLLPDALLDALADASRAELRERAGADADFDRVYQSYRRFLLNTLAVFEVGEDQIVELQQQ